MVMDVRRNCFVSSITCTMIFWRVAHIEPTIKKTKKYVPISFFQYTAPFQCRSSAKRPLKHCIEPYEANSLAAQTTVIGT